MLSVVKGMSAACSRHHGLLCLLFQSLRAVPPAPRTRRSPLNGSWPRRPPHDCRTATSSVQRVDEGWQPFRRSCGGGCCPPPVMDDTPCGTSRHLGRLQRRSFDEAALIVCHLMMTTRSVLMGR